jgi:hypothetical protein
VAVGLSFNLFLLEDGEVYVSGEIAFSIDDLLERYDGLVNLKDRSV